MPNYYLKTIYFYVFEEAFTNSFKNRIKMQKTIYLLQCLGVSVGDYGFMWYKHGLFSQILQNDIMGLCNIEEKQIIFSEDAKAAMNIIKSAINDKNKKYSMSEWLECLGSIHYIRENILYSYATEDEILSELKCLKPGLNKTSDNLSALKILYTIF